MSVFVVRAFVRLREMLASNQQIAPKFSELEQRLEGHDEAIQELLMAIHQLMEPPEETKRRIGFEKPRNESESTGKSSGRSCPRQLLD